MKRDSVLIGIAGLAAVALVGATVTLAVGMSRSDQRGPGAYGGMMGGGFATMMGGRGAGGMMGGSVVPGDGQAGPVASMQDAAARVDSWLRDVGYQGFKVGEVMAFTNGYYAAVEDGSGQGAFELLVDPQTGAVGPEPGPNMMWNTTYGMMGGRMGASMMGGGTMGQAMMDGPDVNAGGGPVPAGEVQAVADRWLAQLAPGERAQMPRIYPGYFTMDTERDGRMVGMISVNARTGAVWYHDWHGRFLDELEL